MEIEMKIYPDIKRKWEGEIRGSIYTKETAGKSKQIWVEVPAQIKGKDISFETSFHLGVELYNDEDKKPKFRIVL